MANEVSIKAKPEYKWYQTLWYYSKRLLRTIVPQIPAGIMYVTEIIPKEYLPFVVFGGGILTGLDKLFRDKGYYK